MITKPSAVCWHKPETLERRESWRDGRPAPTPLAQTAPGDNVPDIYAHERAGLMEALARMAGKAIAYAPGAGTQRLDTVPYEHTLAMVCEWLARNEESPHDVAGDVISGIAMMYTPHTERISRALAAVMAQSFGAARNMRESLLDALCTATVCECIDGQRHTMPPRASRAQIGLMRGFGSRAVWVMADRGLRRASEALKNA